MNGPQAIQSLLAILRASLLTYETAHWTVSGEGYYGKHLMLMRIYEETQKEIDGLGERAVAYWGIGAVDQAAQSAAIAQWLQKWAPIECPVRRSLDAALNVRESIQQAYNQLQSEGQLTLGLDNYLQGVADQKDEHVYLLQQQLRIP